MGEAGGGGAELPLPPMSSFRAAAPHHSPTDPMLVAKPPLQPVSGHGLFKFLTNFVTGTELLILTDCKFFFYIKQKLLVNVKALQQQQF